MASNSLEASRGREGAAPAPEGEAAATAAAAPAAAPGGIKAFLPLIIAVVMMPVLAFVTTKFVLLPKLQSAVSPAKAGAAAAEPAIAEASSKEEGKEGKSAGGKGKATYALSKMLVNVAGTMGTRYLMTSMTLVGNTPDFKNKIEDNKDELLDLANSALRTKTISDLEKPDACNVIRSELMTVFNNALGGPMVQQIYITELAIQ
jgi:flagellar protein FliL